MKEYPGILKPLEGEVKEYPGILTSREVKPRKGGRATRRFQVRSGTQSQEINFQIEQLQRWVGHPLDSLITDLVQIAVAVYVQDIIAPRRSAWSRNMSLTVPVRNKSIWDSHVGMLVSLLSELTGDIYSLSFSRMRGEKSKVEFRTTNDRPVCLFSGGMDSFVGAATHLRLNPLLVSHYASPGIHSVQSRLAAALRTKNTALQHYPVRVNLSRKRAARERTQMSRSFLFLSISTAYAVDIKSDNLIMFENGPIAVNVPISESRVNTKTAHPRVLALFRNLVSNVFGLDMRVSNPFQLLTRGEILRQLDGSTFQRNLADTVSCWRYPRGVISLARALGRPLPGKHCGICYPCMTRRAAMNAAGLYEDGDDQYLVDIFSEYPGLNDQTVATILDLLRFCSKVNELSPISLIGEYPDMSLNVGAVTPGGVVDMYKRFSSEVIQCFRERANPRLAQDLSSLF